MREENIFDIEEEDIFEKLEEEQGKRKRKRTPIGGFLMAELVVLAAMICLVIGTWYYRNHTGRLAEEYVTAFAKEDWNAVYDCLYLEPEDVFTGRKMFVSSMELQPRGNGVVRLKIHDVRQTEKSKEQMVYEVDYTKNGERFVKKVPLVKKAGNWYVSGAEYVRTDLGIRVPEGASVFFDREKLDEQYKVRTENGEDCYVIPRVFDGMHYVVLEKENMEKSEELVRVQDEKEIRLSMQYSQKVLEDAGKQAQAEIQKAYEEAVSDIGEGRTFVSIYLNENKITARPMDDDPTRIEVIMESAYQYQYREKWFIFSRLKTETGRCSNRCIYSWEAGALKLETKEVDTLFL